MNTLSLGGGLSDAPVQSARIFRAAMSAMARPGRIEQVAGAVPPPPLSPAAGCLLLMLCDTNTPLYIAGAFDTSEIRDWVAFHTGAPLTGPEEANFALGRWSDLMPVSRFKIGTSEYPDRSATLIVETDALSASGAVLSGPGIETRAALSLPEIEAFQANAALFPLGLDFFFTHGGSVAALPRSTKVETPCM